MQERMNYDFSQQRTNVAVVNAFMKGVYRWMAIGLGVTAVTAWLVLSQFYAMSAYEFAAFAQKYQFAFFGLLIGEVVLVFALAGAINRMPATVATGMFALYSFLNGITLSFILYSYTASSITSTFLATAVMFGAMSIYGMFTKRDLTSIGSILSMALIGLLVAMVINMFLGSPAMTYLISIVGVVVFAGLTAYDSQKLRQMGEMTASEDAATIQRGTIMGALSLYLDFINLFIMLLRLFGDRR